MKRINPLQVVLERLGCTDSADGAFFFWDEVKNWPAGAFDVLVTSGLLQPAQPMTSVECDSCEDNCFMPVVVYPAQEDKAGRAFITCNEFGRVPVDFRRMEQWQTSSGLIATVLARLLGINQPSTQAAGSRQWRIGTLKGRKHMSPVTLLAGDCPTLSLAGHTVQLVDLLSIEENALMLDKAALIRLVDKPTGGQKAETPEARRERIKTRVHEEKAKGTRAFIKVVAEEECISESRLKQLLKEEQSTTPKWFDLTPKTKGATPKKPKTQR